MGHERWTAMKEEGRDRSHLAGFAVGCATLLGGMMAVLVIATESASSPSGEHVRRSWPFPAWRTSRSSTRQTFGSAFCRRGDGPTRRFVRQSPSMKMVRLELQSCSWRKPVSHKLGNDRKHRQLHRNTYPNRKGFDNEMSGFHLRTCPRGDAGAGAIDRRKTGVNSVLGVAPTMADFVKEAAISGGDASA